LWVMMIVLLGLIVGGSLLALIVLVVFPAVQVVHQANMRSASAANLQKIVTALRAYADDHGSYPPAYTTDDTGRRMHSWRVLILPYLGEQSLYDRYRFDEPWDGPSNTELIAWMPNVYASPADANARLGGETSYMVVVGPATAFPGTQSRRPEDLVDGLDETLLVAEVVTSGVVWHQPQDLDARQMTFQINARPGVEVGSAHPGGAHVALASGRVHFLTSGALPVEVEALTTIDAGDFPPHEILDGR
jgi:type II secretory pathway pseudopilin PulG